MGNSNRLSYLAMIITYLSFSLIILIGHIRDQLGKIFIPGKFKKFYKHNNIPPLYTTFESFFIRRLYQRISDCWNRPIAGCPSIHLKIKERVSNDANNTFVFTGKIIDALNFGSYNYLGFGDVESLFKQTILSAVDEYPLNFAYPSSEFQAHETAQELESEIAEFLFQEDAIVYSMGYGTNTWAISALMANSLIFSDACNHASLITGMRLAKSEVVIFQHNNLQDLEKKLRFHLSQGKPESHRSWEKIFVIVEGIYSMEGTMVDLPELIRLKKKYKFYIYMDEAHSIGAMGRTGRGIAEYLGVNFRDVDLFMGTFSKSFGAAGGYIAGSKRIIDYLRRYSDGSEYAEQLPPVLCVQILETLRFIKSDTSRIEKLCSNTRYLREKLTRLKFPIIGHHGSPVVPILFNAPGKMAEFSRMCLAYGLGIVIVGYPATPVLGNRVRLCVSSSHTTEDIDTACKLMNRIGTVMGMKTR